MVRPAQLGHLAQAAELQFGTFVDLPKIAAPFTSVTNRAQCTDFSSDLRPRMGVERIMVQQVRELEDEVGPAGLQVYAPVNDTHNQIRMIGTWTNSVSLNGARAEGLAGSSVEITFYGTGLNLLCIRYSGSPTFDVTLNGVSAGTMTPASDGVLSSRGYGANHVVSVVSGLTLGLYTVKLTSASVVLSFYGFEVLNESTSLKTTPGSAFKGGKKGALAALDTQTYNTDFESGLLGNRGGRVVVYLQDGEIKKALTPTNGAQANLTSADHTNEEITRVYNFREFGAGRSDDFSTIVSGSTHKAYTLDDGTTTLSGSSISGANAALELLVNGTGKVHFTFVGTGLDLIFDVDAAGTNVVEYFVDNVSIGQYTNPATDFSRVVKVVSGLPYGTHVVTAVRISATATPSIRSFVTYGPKKPTIPTDAIELADYNIVADFVASTVIDDEAIATGVIRKNSFREFVYVGTWGVSGIGTANPYATQVVRTSTLNSSAEYTFVGTGCDIRWAHFNTGGSFTGAVTVDGASNLTAYSPLISSSDGTCSITAATGVITSTGSTTNNGTDHLRLTGLPYGKHTVKITKTSANGVGIMDIAAIDIIVPVYSPTQSLPGSLNSYVEVGSNSIGDSRLFAESDAVDIPNWAQAEGQGAGSTTVDIAVGTGGIPATDMTCVVKTSGKPIEIHFTAAYTNTVTGASGDAGFNIMVDGVWVRSSVFIDSAQAGYYMLASLHCIVPVSAGVHIVQVYWGKSGAAATIAFVQGGTRLLTVKEL
jgi:hypothetical protein